MQDMFEIQFVNEDQFLRSLFRPLQEEKKQQTQRKVEDSQMQEPEHFDPRDIERDYLSQCPPTHKKIRKSKRKQLVINRTVKVRRQRKNKLYIEMLQNRIFELQREIEVLRRANHTNKQTLKKNNDAEHIVNGFFLNKQRHYQKLNTFKKQADIDQHRFMEEYGMLRLRQGAVGKDRIKVINYYFKELSEIMIPDLQKYILKTAEEESDLFDPNYVSNGALGSYVEQWRKDLIFDLQLSYQKVFHLSQLKEEILAQKKNMERLFSDLYDSKCKIQEVARRIEKIYDRVNSIFSPRDIAKCLCLIEKYKFEKGFSIADIFVGPFSKLEEEQKELYDPEHLYQSQ